MKNPDVEKLADIWQSSDQYIRELIKSKKLTVCAAADMLGVGKRQVYHLIEEGQLPAYRLKNALRVPEKGVTDFIARQMLKTSLE